MEKQYKRIGTEYYKVVYYPLHSGDKMKTLAPWKKGEIITDEGKDYIQTIPKYDGFCLIPSHTDYKYEIEGFYNRYEHLEHTFKEGDFPITKKYLKHIFGEQYELGIDYITILWHMPTQVLPILCLVSKERNTGKTTFLDWLKLIFQNNMTLNKNEDFRSKFNSDWASKLIIAVDEVLLDRKEDSERLKNLSTAKSYKSEAKGKDKVEGNFFGKFILNSNNEENFVYIDDQEIRYWVRKIDPIPKEEENPDLIKLLKKELPMFMDFINTRSITSNKRSRMWFTKEQIHTLALDVLMKGNKTYVSRELEQILMDEFDKFETEELKYSVGDLVEKLAKNNIRVSSFKISEVLKKQYGMESSNSTYTKYHLAISPITNKSMIEELGYKGRHFTFTKDMFEK